MQALARDLLVSAEPPVRLPTVRELARQHRSSLSSIHFAMTRLQEAGAVDIEMRGRLGAFLIRRSMGRLWSVAEGGRPLVIAFPLASSPRYEALATAIKQLISATDVEVFFVFVRGSRQRLQALHDGRCHLAVMSAFAAGELRSPDDAVVVDLPPMTYNTGHRVFYSAAADPSRPTRVIVDQHSVDQQLLTALEFQDEHTEHLPAMTAQIARLLAEGRGDAAIWTMDEMRVRWPVGVLDRPLSQVVRDRIGDSDTRAVLVGKATDASVLRAMTASVDGTQVERIQLDVMAGRIVPEY